MIVQFVASQVNKGKTVVEALKMFGSIAGEASQWGVMLSDKQ